MLRRYKRVFRAYFNYGCFGLLTASLVLGSGGCRSGLKTVIKDEVKVNDSLIFKVLSKNQNFFPSVIGQPANYRLQLLFTEIKTDRKGRLQFTDHHYRTDSGEYFYPASTVKLPVAVLALQRLRELAIPGLSAESTMITGAEGPVQTPVYNDPSAPDGRPSIAHYIKKILLVSDNDAYNRLYEFLGPDYINRTLSELGYRGVSIRHRLSLPVGEADNRHTNPVRFYNAAGQLLYEQPARTAPPFAEGPRVLMGKGFIRNGRLVEDPFDFSTKNRLPLEALHQMVRAILFPESLPAERRFRLAPEDYAFLRLYMGMLPGESRAPVCDPGTYWDTYVKFLFYGSEKNSFDPAVRIYNKVGDAYGFLTDAALITDSARHIQFLLSATIYCNSDGIFNDDQYDYDTVGLPFLKQVGRWFYEREKQRVAGPGKNP